MLRPLLKQAGGKGKFRHIIEPMYNKHRDKRWVDVFCGGLSLPLAIQPERVWINDLNEYLTNFYQYVIDYGKFGGNAVELKNEEEYYYSVREMFNKYKHLMGSPTAEMYYYLNRTCFNGLMRFNKSGNFNSPFGHYKHPSYQTDFSAYQKLLSGWKMTNLDWRRLKFKEDDFIYLDPVYDTEFTAYTAEGFTWQDQVDLAERFSKVNNPAILHNQATDRIIELYTKLGYDIQYVFREDKINSHRPKNNKVKEVVATRNI
jgi:DNA adenine methylase